MEKIKSFIKQHNRLTIVMVVLLALSLPFVINQVLKQQDLRQRASIAVPSIQVYMKPGGTTNVGTTTNAYVLLTTSTNDVGSLKTKIIHDPTMVELSNFTFPSKLQVFQEDKSTEGVYGITLLNPDSDVVTGEGLVVVSFQVKALKAGTTKIEVAHQSTAATATGYYSYLPIDNVSNMIATYTIVNGVTPSLAPATANNNPTITPSGTLRTFNYNNGKDHCRPAGESCESVLNESEVPNSSCSSYLGVNARTCRTSGYPPITNTLLSECSTLSPDGYVRYCIPNGGEIPTGWTAVVSGDSACTDYNGLASKCYKSTFLANLYGDPQPGATLSGTPTLTVVPSATPILTATLYPTPTYNPGETYIKISFSLPGIGVGSANLGLNSTPLNPQRDVWITVLDEANNPIVTNQQGRAIYNPTSGKYEGKIGLGLLAPTPTLTPALSDKFVVKIKINNSLYKRTPGISTIHYGSPNNSSTDVALVSGDLNNDNTLGVIDWTFMIACVKNEASCTEKTRKLADLNDNGSIDETDVQILQRGFALRDGD